MSRQLIVTLVILACGLVPTGSPGMARRGLRDSLQSSLLNRVDLERVEHGYYERLLDSSRRLDDLSDLPGLRSAGSPGSPWSVPFDDAPLVMRVDDLREVVLKRDDDTTRKGVHWHTNSQGMRDRDYALAKAPRNVSDRAGGRLDRRGLGCRRRRAVRVDPGARLERAGSGGQRDDRRDHQLRRAGAFTGPALVPFQPGRLADEAGPGDL